MRIVPAFVVAIALLFAAATAFAQSSPAVAEALFEEGRAAMKVEDYATACEKFAESNRIDRQVGTELNLATCSEKLGKIATAWALYKGVRDALEPDDDRRPIADERIEALQDRVPRLTLTLAPGAPADTVVTLGDLEVRGASFGAGLALDPGVVRMVVTAPGYAPREVEATLTEGRTTSVEVAPGPPAAPTPEPSKQVEPAPALPAPAPAPEPESNSQAAAGWVIFGVGLASVLVGAGTGIAGLVRKGDGEDQCSDTLMLCTPDGVSANDDARALLTTTTVMWIAGAALSATGLVLVLTAGSDDATSVGLTLRLDGPGVVWSTRF